jgi:hypothetical protein
VLAAQGERHLPWQLDGLQVDADQQPALHQPLRGRCARRAIAGPPGRWSGGQLAEDAVLFGGQGGEPVRELGRVGQPGHRLAEAAGVGAGDLGSRG